MEIAGITVPIAVVILVVVSLSTTVVALVDLSRHEVKELPKWGWALIIIFISFPIGAIVYVILGRVRKGEEAGSAVAALAMPTAMPPTAMPSTAMPSTAMRWPPPQTQQPHREINLTDVVVATHGLRKVYGGTAALDGVDLSVPRGVTYGLIGPNGAGKTTMLSILAGLRQPTEGTVDLGVPRQAMGVLVDTPQFEPWLTAREVVDLARHLTAPDLPHARVEEVLAQVGLTGAIDRRVAGFSRGMLQRLGLAGCLVGDPEVLLLDEPSSALDPAGRREVLDLVGRLAHTKTVILSTHILSDVQQVADVVGVIDKGRLQFQGLLADLLARSSVAYTIHLRTGSAEMLDELRRQSWTREVSEQAPGRLRVVVSDAASAERGIPRILADHDLQLVAFNPATDLETAFLELTR